MRGLREMQSEEREPHLPEIFARPGVQDANRTHTGRKIG